MSISMPRKAQLPRTATLLFGAYRIQSHVQAGHTCSSFNSRAMSTQADLAIPTIDVSSFLKQPSSPAAREVIDQVRAACETTGFFQIVNHGIPSPLQESVFTAARKFFALPMEEKRSLDAKHNVGHRGYDVLESQSYEEGVLPDLKEGLYVGNDIPASDERTKSGRFFMGPNVWPQSLNSADLRQPVEAYYSAVYALSLRVLDMMAPALPYDVKDLFSRFTGADLVAAPLRLVHYPPARATKQRQLGSSAHTDFGAITLLLSDGVPGLEVQNRKSGSWMQVPPSEDAYVVHVGDMLQMWTGGRLKSSVHRVLNGEERDRYSIVFFFDGNLDCPLTPLDEKDRIEGQEVPTVEGHMLKRMADSYGKGKK